MKIFIIGLFTCTIITAACVKKITNEDAYGDKLSSDNSLSFINGLNEIEISHTDDKYGEWGGDTDIILIYSEGNELYAKYSRYCGSTSPPRPPKENEKNKEWYEYLKLEFTIVGIKLNDSDKKLIADVILELLNNRLKNTTEIGFGGNRNSIVSKDSSLIIYDYPSIKWNSFEKLKTELRNR